jgi:hypothetical protein
MHAKKEEEKRELLYHDNDARNREVSSWMRKLLFVIRDAIAVIDPGRRR